MFAKGNNMFQGSVKQEAESISNLLAFVPVELEKLRKRMQSEIEFVEPEECEEWDEDQQKFVLRMWYPSVDTSIVDEMLDTFYSSIVGKIYNYAENGLRILADVVHKPKFPKGKKRPSDIDLYFQEIERKQGITLPPIEELWPNKENFHSLRKQITHYGKGYLKTKEIEQLDKDLNDVLNMLLFIEEQIRQANPNFRPVLEIE